MGVLQTRGSPSSSNITTNKDEKQIIDRKWACEIGSQVRMKIAIISPQDWNHIPISKHHYAMEFARRGHEILFVNPPDPSLTSVKIHSTQYPTLQTLTYPRPWFHKLRFHARPLYDFLMKRQVRSILRQAGFQLDVCWCFDFNLYSDLSVFGAKVNIFHPVDPLSEPEHLKPTKNADLVFTVSNRIAESLNDPRAESIGHALSKPFADLATARLTSLTPVKISDPINVGYAGNLMRKPLNRQVVRKVIEGHPNVRFHFWGPYEVDDSEAGRFVAYLDNAPHVTLHGRVEPEQLADALQTVDLLLLVYGLDQAESDRSNSHKLLEYLSTGRTTVCSRIDEYVQHPDLIEMPSSGDDDEIPELFADVIIRLSETNSVERAKARIEFSLNHTYTEKAEQIESMIMHVLDSGE